MLTPSVSQLFRLNTGLKTTFSSNHKSKSFTVPDIAQSLIEHEEVLEKMKYNELGFGRPKLVG